MKEAVRKFSKKYAWTEKIWIIIWWIATKIRYCIYTDYQYAVKLCKSFTQEKANIDNPKTFNEKMWYLKLANRDPLLTVCSDKHEVRKYVSDCGFVDILKKEYGFYSSTREINFNTLESPCYIKCNHASGMNYIYRKENNDNLSHIKWKLDYFIKQNSYMLSREWNYKNITPGIVCEELLCMPNGEDIPELQFFCFHGKPKFIMYNLGLADQKGNHKKSKRWVFDMGWNHIDVITSMPTSPIIPEKPKNFDYMVEIAEKLSNPFPHVRVDLFNIDGKIFFNELTFYSGGGNVFLKPAEWQYVIGAWIDCSQYHIAKDATAKHRAKKRKEQEV